MKYAKKLNVEKILSTYMEVLIWVEKPWV
jgi:hypothetical protein